MFIYVVRFNIKTDQIEKTEWYVLIEIDFFRRLGPYKQICRLIIN